MLPPIDATWASLISAVLVALIGWLATKTKASADKEAHTGPQWESFSQKIMDRMDDQQEEINTLKTEVNNLRARVEEISQKYWRAVLALRRVFDRNPDAVTDAELPEDVHTDVFGK